jgi:hypothetical protein
VARVVIEDNGTGIPQEDIEKIFILFNSSKKGGRGTGLGLSVSNKILHEHGGRIDVESTVGKGSRFILQFPAVYPEETGSGDDIRRTAPMKPPGPGHHTPESGVLEQDISEQPKQQGKGATQMRKKKS